MAPRRCRLRADASKVADSSSSVNEPYRAAIGANTDDDNEEDGRSDKESNDVVPEKARDDAEDEGEGVLDDGVALVLGAGTVTDDGASSAGEGTVVPQPSKARSSLRLPQDLSLVVVEMVLVVGVAVAGGAVLRCCCCCCCCHTRATAICSRSFNKPHGLWYCLRA